MIAASAALRRLERERGHDGAGAGGRKLALLAALADASLRTAGEVRRLHEALCFLRAYPDDARVLAAVERMLGQVQSQAARTLGLRSLRELDSGQRKAFAGFAPLVLLAGAGRWPSPQRRALWSLIRAKAAVSELDYVRRLAAHRALCKALLAQ